MAFQYSFSDYNNIISLVYQGAHEPTPWLNFANALRNILGSREAFLITYSNNNVSPSYVVSSNNPDKGDNTEYLNEVLRFNSEFEEAGDDGPKRNNKEGTNPTLYQFNLVTRHQPHVELKDILYQDVYQNNEKILRIAVVRTEYQNKFGGPEKELLSLITVHLLEAMTLRDHYEQSSSLATQAMDLLGKMSIGTLVVDAKKNVMTANQAAISMLSKNHGISIKDEKLHFSSSKSTNKFGKALDMMIAAHQRGMKIQKGAAVGLESQDGIPGLDIVVKPIFHSKITSAMSKPAALILLNDRRPPVIE